MERVAERGPGEAFVYYADENAVLVRNNRLIRGKKEIMEYYGQQENKQDVQLTWEPDIIDVADCGDFAYTVGTYIYSFKDSAGQESSTEGIFHTVWKRQEDGSWKYVYD
jgi:ketosteroid isomerase-like protein